MHRLAVLLTVAAVAGALGCSSTDTVARGGRPLVVATTTQVADFVRQIGGRRVDVYQVLKANVDPHDYEASPADLDAMARADLIVKSGVGIEAWSDDAVKSSGSEAPVVDASHGVRLRHGNGGEEGRAGDPHIWLDPTNAKTMCRNIARALERVDPRHRRDLNVSLGRYLRRLDALDADIRHQVATLTNRTLVTNHDAFGYYIDRYHLRSAGSIIPSFDTSAELSARDISDLARRIRDRRVKAVFSEASLPPKTAQALARRAGVRVVAGADALYGDTLGPEGSSGDTYLKMMRHDTSTIVRNLR